MTPEEQHYSDLADKDHEEKMKFNLSECEFRVNEVGECIALAGCKVIEVSDIKEFIRLLKEAMNNRNIYPELSIEQILEKYAGDKLI